MARMWRRGVPIECWWECKLNTLEISVPKTRVLGLSYSASGTCPKVSISNHRDTCTSMFPAVLFTIAREWIHP